ncbi:MAG: hypothetical protein FWD71_06570 [Oscillospiraceae bacterium]|nr:hypothetical protein [Oscillospiraceae bacterium]
MQFLFMFFGIVGGITFLSFKNNKIKSFLSLQSKSNEYVFKHPRNEMVFFVLKTWGIIFIIAFFSFGILWFYTLFIWVNIGFIFYRFVKSWKYHGYSTAVLLSSTGIIIILSFVISTPIRNIIGNIVLY